MWATAKTFSPDPTFCGPRTVSSLGARSFFFPLYRKEFIKHQQLPKETKKTIKTSSNSNLKQT
jgi:hypothetical protein